MKVHYYKLLLLSLFICFLKSNYKAQNISTDRLIRFPLLTSEQINDSLDQFGWKKTNVELITDSNFIRHSWELKPKMSGAEFYFLYYEFVKDTAENYIIYQFSDRADFAKFKKEFQNKGYKQVSNKSKKKNNVHKEHETLFYSKKTHSLVVIKETFYYGLFSFLIYSYKPDSAVSKLHMNSNGK